MFSFACNKDNENTPDNFVSDKLNFNEVVSNTQIATISGSDFGVTSFEYNEGRVSTVTDISEFMGENGFSSSTENTFTLNYSSEGLESISASYLFTSTINGQTDTSRLAYTRTFIYNSDNQVIQAIINLDSSDVEAEAEINYLYDDRGNLVKVDEGDGYYQLFEWENNNVSLESSWYDETNNNSGLRNSIWNKRNKIKSTLFRNIVPEKSFQTEFSEYDNNQNPLGILAVIYGNSNGLFISRNNPTKALVTYYNSDGSIDETESSTIEYEYNSEGLPTRLGIGGNETETLFITYN